MIALAMMLADPPEQRWSCVYPGYPDGKPVALTLDLKSGFLTEVEFGLRYKVVFDDGRALIGAYPAVGPTNGRYTINVRTIVIDRLTGNMIQANTDLGATGDENKPSEGHCGQVFVLGS